MDCSPQAPLSMWILQARILERVAMPSSRGLSHPGIKPAALKSPALAGGFFTTRATFGGSMFLSVDESRNSLSKSENTSF